MRFGRSARWCNLDYISPNTVLSLNGATTYGWSYPCKCNGTIFFTNNRDDGEVKKLYGYTFGGGVNTVNEHNLGGRVYMEPKSTFSILPNTICTGRTIMQLLEELSMFTMLDL